LQNAITVKPMIEFGYKLMSEEHGPTELVENALHAEEVGFDFVAISDHFNPWVAKQGHSPAAWPVLGAIAARTKRVGITTAVTCPTIRYHPAIIAQNAATLAVLSGERFTLGLGSGENLNEHVVGAGWPAPRARQAMLSEAVDIIEQLWTGEELSHEGEFFEVDRAQLWDVPKTPPRLAIAAGGSKAAELAGKKGAGLFATEAKAPLVEAWQKAGGRGARYAEVAISYAKSEEEAVRVAHERFSFGLLGWKVLPELPTPKSFEGALAHVKPQDVAESITCGPDPERHVQAVRKYIEAGFDHLVLVGVGPDQQGFLRFWKEELAPRLRKLDM
jgi:G6PDH family F420-dependent oxidoreductase